MEIKREKINDIDIIKLSGRLDGSTAGACQSEVIPGIESGEKMILDMEGLEYVSSAGLRVLMIIAKTLRSKGGKGVLAGMAEEVKDVMEMTGFGNIFENFASIAEAADYLQKGE